MAVTFNTPPGWPAAPAGFIPPLGWEPEPTWGPAPEGWVFYLDDGMPSAAPSGAWQPPAAIPPTSASSAPWMSSATPASPWQQPANQPPPPPQSVPAPPAFSQPQSAPAPNAFTPQPGTAAYTPQPPPKKSHGMVWLIVGVVVLALGVAALGIFVFTRPGKGSTPSPSPSQSSTSPSPSDPTLTRTQFSQLFLEGSTFNGDDVSDRYTSAATPSPRTDACEQELLDVIVDAPALIIAKAKDSSGSVTAALNASSYDTPADATLAYTGVTTACTEDESGDIENAQYINTTFGSTTSSYDAVVLRYGNVIAIAYVASAPIGDDIAQALFTEVDDAANS